MYTIHIVSNPYVLRNDVSDKMINIIYFYGVMTYLCILYVIFPLWPRNLSPTCQKCVLTFKTSEKTNTWYIELSFYSYFEHRYLSIQLEEIFEYRL